MLIILYFLSKYVQTYNEQLFPWKNEPATKFHQLKGKLFLVKWELKKVLFLKCFFNDRKHKYFLQLFNSENNLHNAFELEKCR